MARNCEAPTLVHVLYHEADPDLAGPTNILGVFRDDDQAKGIEHAQARAGILLGAHQWTFFPAEPETGLRRRWECEVKEGRGTSVAVIEPHAIEPVPAPPRTGRRPKPRTV